MLNVSSCWRNDSGMSMTAWVAAAKRVEQRRPRASSTGDPSQNRVNVGMSIDGVSLTRGVGSSQPRSGPGLNARHQRVLSCVRLLRLFTLDMKYARTEYVPVAYSRRNTGRSSGKASITGCAEPIMLPMLTITSAPKWPFLKTEKRRKGIAWRC